MNIREHVLSDFLLLPPNSLLRNRILSGLWPHIGELTEIAARNGYQFANIAGIGSWNPSVLAESYTYLSTWFVGFPYEFEVCSRSEPVHVVATEEDGIKILGCDGTYLPINPQFCGATMLEALLNVPVIANALYLMVWEKPSDMGNFLAEIGWEVELLQNQWRLTLYLSSIGKKYEIGLWTMEDGMKETCRMLQLNCNSYVAREAIGCLIKHVTRFE